MGLDIGQSLIPIPNSQIPNEKVSNNSRNRERKSKTSHGTLKPPGSKNKHLERRRRRQKCSRQNAAKPILFNPSANTQSSGARFAMKISFTASSRNVIQQHATQHRPQRRH